jgi:hypothetical protein
LVEKERLEGIISSNGEEGVPMMSGEREHSKRMSIPETATIAPGGQAAAFASTRRLVFDTTPVPWLSKRQDDLPSGVSF